MKGARQPAGRHFRVWLAECSQAPPRGSGDLPRHAVALEPAEEGTMSRAEAAAYVEAFNRETLRRGGNICAVALPVTVVYQGEPRRGERMRVEGERGKGGKGEGEDGNT